MLRSTYRKKVNPEKSNKMIWAVGIGLLVILAIFALFGAFSSPASAREALLNTIGYLEHTKGIISLTVSPDARTVTIIYDSLESNDYATMTHYAAVRASAKVRNTELLMAENKAERVMYRIVVRDGQIASEEDLRPQKK